ncbi:MAG: FHA domain-containing protein [Nitrospirae bacterium]|nr:FHA domain-containing protein [Nitrospirota bacterium]
MATVILKFNATVLKEIKLDRPQLTIGRKPDNDLVIDSPTVSGHHARITDMQGAFVLEDLGSANGTFVNDQKVAKQPLKPADRVTIGKHVLVYQDEAKTPHAVPPSLPKPVDSDKTDNKVIGPEPPKQPEPPKEAKSSFPAPTPPPKPIEADRTMSQETPAQQERPKAEGTSVEAPKPKERVGVLQIVEGHTDRKKYQLAGRLAIIGSQAGATVKLKGWFAPKTAALISRRNEGYSVSSLSKEGKHVLLNGLPIQGRADLKDGDLLEIAGVKMYFYLNE